MGKNSRLRKLKKFLDEQSLLDGTSEGLRFSHKQSLSAEPSLVVKVSRSIKVSVADQSAQSLFQAFTGPY
jgi:hypothetical protein